LLRAAGGADPDRRRPVPRRPGQSQGAGRTRLLPDRVLFPVGDQLRGHHGRVPLPVQRFRGRERGPQLDSDPWPQLVRRPSGRVPHRLGVARCRGGPFAPRGRRAARGDLVGVGVRPVGGHDGAHRPGGVHHVWNLHALVPRRPAGDRQRHRGGGARRRCRPGPQVLLDHPADAEADAVHCPHSRPDRHVAGLRPDLSDGRRLARQDHAHTGFPGLLGVVREPEVGEGGGDLVHPLRDHRRAHDLPALGAPRPGRRVAARPAAKGSYGPGRGGDRGQTRRSRHGRRRPHMTTVTTRHEAAPVMAVKTGRWRRLPPKVIAGRIGSYVMLIALATIYIFPFVVSIASSLKTNAEATQQPLRLVPETLTFAAYERLFTDVPLLDWTFNSALVTVCVTLGRVFLGSLAGYALSRLQFRGRGVIFVGVIAVMAVPT